MCEQCLTWPVSFGDPIPGFVLMRARRDGNEWMKGEWGLIECNDPSFLWRSTPTPSPTWGMTDDEEEAWLEGRDRNSPEVRRAFMSPPQDFVDAFESMSARQGYYLVKAAMDKGYDPDKSGCFTHWFWDYLGAYLVTAPMEDEGDCFPDREKFAPVDLTIGRDPIPGEPVE